MSAGTKEADPHGQAGGDEPRAKDKSDDARKGDGDEKGGGSKKSDEGKKKEREDEEKRRKRRPWVIAGGSVAVLALIVGGTWYWLSSRGKESTDDAYTDGTPVTIAPKVAGYVVELRISDNTRLRAGDLILRIDPRDYAASRDQAQAQLEVAQAQLDHRLLAIRLRSRRWHSHRRGYTGKRAKAAEHGIKLEMVKLPDPRRSFRLLPRCWITERTVARMACDRRLARDHERLPESVVGLHLVAFAITLLLRAADFASVHNSL